MRRAVSALTPPRPPISHIPAPRPHIPSPARPSLGRRRALTPFAPDPSVQAMTPSAATALQSEARLRLLTSLPFFRKREAPLPLLRALAAVTILQRVAPATVLFAAGEQATHAFLLVAGRADVHAPPADGATNPLGAHVRTATADGDTLLVSAT